MRLARSAQGYLAGFGTAGSLLAGAALMFILASALVAFRGWPHVAAQPSPGEVVVSPRPTAASASLVSRRLAVISAPAAPAGARPGGRPGGAGGGAAVVVVPGAGRPGGAVGAVGAMPGSGHHTIGQPPSTSVPVPTSSAGAAPSALSCVAGGCASPAPSNSGGSGPTQPLQPVVKQAAGAVAPVVSGTGNQVGSGVQQTTGAAGGAAAPVSPPAAGAVNSVGSGVSKTVTTVRQGIAGTLSGLGQ
ncbi:MAG: hypothetical protein JO130_11530 [Solirubrobacterales bacterium]|nr:hypothetical protein [Solirubrobacterales bacterium]